jgi:hypothetical protein
MASSEAWRIIYYCATDGTVPADAFLKSCPASVEAHLLAILSAVAQAPPPRHSGGGKWEAMHGEMAGFYEVRTTGPGRAQYRLFCILENAEAAELRRRGLEGPAIAVITGLRKPWRTKFTDADYAAVRSLGDEHRSRHPRRIKA